MADPDVAAPPDVAALLADLAGIGPFFAVGTGALPGEGWVPVGALGDPRGPLADRIEAVEAALAASRRGPSGPSGWPHRSRSRASRLRSSRRCSRRWRCTGRCRTRRPPASAPGAALAPRRRGAVAVVARRRAGVVAVPGSRRPRRRWSRSCSPRSSPPSGRRPRSPSGCCGATRRRPWRARGSWSRRSARTPPRAPPPSAGTCSPRHRSRPRRRCATPHRPTSAWTFRRRSCCLYYRVPGGGICGDCVLRRPVRRTRTAGDRSPPLA